MKLLIVTIGFLLAGCTTMPVGSSSAKKPEGDLLASIKLTNDAFTGRPQGNTGHFFYTEDEPGVAGPRLTGYVYRNGKMLDLFGGASDSASVVQEINDVGLEPFDFEKEASATFERLNREAEARGQRFIGPMVMDGAEYEITIHTPHGTFFLKEWNPGPTIDALAPHSTRIAKLKAVLDILARYYGRTKFDV